MVPVLVSHHSSHAHPNHPLVHHSHGRDYTCHACNISGSGARFRCDACSVDIHVYCAGCPDQFSSFLHSHPLALAPRPERRICDVCREPIGGMLYRCEDCGFDVHPLCTRIPQEVRHVIDRNHKLRLKKVPSGNCAVCGDDCSSLWVYGCDVCVVNINIHPKCLLKPYRSETSPVPPSGSRGVKRAPPHSPGYGYHDPNFMNPNGFSFGYGGGYPSHAHVSPVGFPHHYHSAYTPSPYHFAYTPPPPSPIYGSVPSQPNHGGHNHTPPSIGELMLESTIFSLLENFAEGAITEFLFGSY